MLKYLKLQEIGIKDMDNRESFGVLGGTYSQYLNLEISRVGEKVIAVNLNAKDDQKSRRAYYMAQSIKFRDQLISQICKDLEVRTALDLGCDFGSLIAHQLLHGITNPIGIDIDPIAVTEGVKNSLNISLQDLSRFMEDDIHYDCVTSLNITQKKWKNETARFELINQMLMKSNKICVITLFENDLKKINLNREIWHTFRLGSRKTFTEKNEIRLMYGWPFGSKLPFMYENMKIKFLKIEFEDFHQSYINLPVVFIRK